MKCAEAELLISIWVDGEPIAKPAESALEAHLAACPCCRQAMKLETERARLIDSALAAPGGVPAELASEISRAALAGIQGGDSRHGSRWLPGGRIQALAPLALTLATVAAAAGGLWVYFGPMVPGGAHVEAAGRYVLEESLQDQDVVASKDGAPLGRDVSRTHWIYVIPTTGQDQGPAGQLKLDVERVDTHYTKLIDWDYH